MKRRRRRRSRRRGRYEGGESGLIGRGAQSRQSAKLFSSRRNWDSPTPSPAGECAPPPFCTGGEGHTRWRGGGGRVPIQTRGHTLWCFIYTVQYVQYFVKGRESCMGGREEGIERNCFWFDGSPPPPPRFNSM